MKGTITTCLAELVETKFGAERWTAILDAAGVDAKLRPRLKMATSDVDDAVALALLEATSRVLGVTPRQAADAFGEH